MRRIVYGIITSIEGFRRSSTNQSKAELERKYLGKSQAARNKNKK